MLLEEELLLGQDLLQLVAVLERNLLQWVLLQQLPLQQMAQQQMPL